MATKKVIGYARVSTETQDLKRQISLIKDFCNGCQYHYIRTIDEKISGAKHNRKSINELLSVDRTEADIIVVAELSRLSREADIMRVLSIINDILQNGLDVILLDDPNKTYSAYSSLSLFDIMTLAFKANTAAEERQKIINRTTSGKISVLQINPYSFMGQKPPFGFKVVNNPNYIINHRGEPKTLLEIDENEADLIKYIYNSVLSGTTLRQIARNLNNLGKRTVRNGLKFTESTISKTVRNPLYKGERQYKDLILKITPIISAEDWELATKRLIDNQLFRGKSSKNFNPLKGLLYCPCGYSLLLHYNSGSGFFKYSCVMRNNDPDYRDSKKCQNSGLQATLLLNCVWYAVINTITDLEYLAYNEQEIKEHNQQIKILLDSIENLKLLVNLRIKEREAVYKRISLASDSELIERFEQDYITYGEEISDINHKIIKLNNEITTHKDAISRISKVRTQEQLQHIGEIEKSNLYREKLDRVVYYSVNLLNGFIIINFKNGIQRIIAVRNTGKKYVALLPTTFEFNENERTVSTTVFPKATIGNYSFDNGTIAKYDVAGLIRVLGDDYNIYPQLPKEEIDFKGIAKLKDQKENE